MYRCDILMKILNGKWSKVKKIKYIMSVYLKFGVRTCVSADGPAGLEPGKIVPPPQLE